MRGDCVLRDRSTDFDPVEALDLGGAVGLIWQEDGIKAVLSERQIEQFVAWWGGQRPERA